MTKTAEPIMLDHRVDLYIPSQCICTGSLPEGARTKVIEEVKGNFDNWFGGHAEIPIKGGLATARRHDRQGRSRRYLLLLHRRGA